MVELLDPRASSGFLFGAAAIVVLLLVLRRNRQVRRALEMKDRRLTLALAASRAAVFEFDPREEGFVFAQDFSQVTAGFATADVPSVEDEYGWWLERLPEEDGRSLTAALARLARGEESEARLELRLRRKGDDDAWVYLDVLLTRAVSHEGRETVIGVLRDVTEARLVEEERRELVAQIAQSNRLEALGKLAGGIAHDFNNLLTVINGNVELARDLGPQEEVRTLLGEVQEAGEKASALTRQLLQFSRREPGPRRPVSLNRVVRAVERILRRLIGSSIELVTELDRDAGHLLGDPSRIEQVLFNLVTNARDALPDGGSIVISTRGMTRGKERRVALSVRDDGVGMPVTVKSHIFDPFFSTKPRESGSGLGLSTVYGIVRESGGEIEVTSEVGVGSEFLLHWPRVEDETAGETAIETADGGGHERVLVVEDDPSVARFIRLALEQSGYDVLLAANGEEALAALRLSSHEVALVVSDVVMPRMGGFELAAALRERAPDLPVLLVSGFAEGRVASREDAVHRLLDKPFTRPQLLAEVRAALDRAPSSRPV